MSAATATLEGRVDALTRALDEVLNDAPSPRPRRRSPRPRRRCKKAPRAYSPSLHTSLVITALADVVLASAPGCGLRSMALGWYELKARTRLSDDHLGMAVCELTPLRLCTRHDGDERIYFLPSKHRAALLRKRLSGRPVGAQVAA